jgi:hypothetical protein
MGGNVKKWSISSHTSRKEYKTSFVLRLLKMQISSLLAVNAHCLDGTNALDGW